MFICKDCNKDMADPAVATCTKETITSADGTTYTRIPFPMIHEGKVNNRKCHDCGVMPGGIHHLFCVVEQCPRCSGQLLSCSCFDEGELMLPEAEKD